MESLPLAPLLVFLKNTKRKRDLYFPPKKSTYFDLISAPRFLLFCCFIRYPFSISPSFDLIDTDAQKISQQ